MGSTPLKKKEGARRNENSKELMKPVDYKI